MAFTVRKIVIDSGVITEVCLSDGEDMVTVIDPGGTLKFAPASGLTRAEMDIVELDLLAIGDLIVYALAASFDYKTDEQSGDVDIQIYHYYEN